MTINEYIDYNNFSRCDKIFHAGSRKSMNHIIQPTDYIPTSDCDQIIGFDVIDIDIRDHVHILSLTAYDSIV